MTIDIKPIDPVSRAFFAGVVSGIDLTRPLSDPEVAAVHAGMEMMNEPAAGVVPPTQPAAKLMSVFPVSDVMGVEVIPPIVMTPPIIAVELEATVIEVAVAADATPEEDDRLRL